MFIISHRKHLYSYHMFKYLFLLFLISFGNAFSQHAKKKSKVQPKENSKEYSREHFTDFKLITDMMDSVKKVNYIRFNMKSVERIETGFSVANTKIKLQSHPRKTYLLNTEKKLEILYNEGELNNKALVKPHVFPYFTMTLEPRGKFNAQKPTFYYYGSWF